MMELQLIHMEHKQEYYVNKNYYLKYQETVNSIFDFKISITVLTILFCLFICLLEQISLKIYSTKCTF